jgi:hypothetical protein
LEKLPVREMVKAVRRQEAWEPLRLASPAAPTVRSQPLEAELEL